MIGSLNSMGYLEPHNLFERLINKLCKKQKIDIETQYEKYNVRAFDLHLYFLKKKGKAIFKYNNIEYNTFSVFEILNYLNKKGDTYVRIVLEDNGDFMFLDDRAILEVRFIEYCQMIESIYHNIKFFGGYRKYDSKQLYKFKNKEPDGLVFYNRVDKINSD